MLRAPVCAVWQGCRIIVACIVMTFGPLTCAAEKAGPEVPAHAVPELVNTSNLRSNKARL